MSDENTQITLNTKKLDEFIKAISNNKNFVRVGVLGSSGDNATIGAVHEFGTSQIPQRSFLREPLAASLDKELDKADMVTDEALNSVIEDGGILSWLKKLSVVAETIVIKAFMDEGSANQKWASWKNPNYENNTGMILSDTQQLRNSISTDIK